jgi:hypothetical protein
MDVELRAPGFMIDVDDLDLDVEAVALAGVDDNFATLKQILEAARR